MIKRIFLVLCGDMKSRADALIKEIREIAEPNWNDIKIIISGKSGWKFNVDVTEAEEMQKYLNKHNIPKKAIILEKESMDTLGNIYFSSKIILDYLNKLERKECNKIILTLIKNGYHMHRAKHFFNQIFSRWVFKFPVEYKYVNANPNFKSFFQKLKVNAKEPTIEIAIEADFARFKINTFQDYENYLFSLPIYSQFYNAKKKLVGYSAYATLIEEHLKS